MLAVAKAPHIDLRIKGDIPPSVIAVLQKEYGKTLVLKNDKKELVRYRDTSTAKEAKKRKSTGLCIRIHRENLEMTQAQLGEKIGVKASFISDLEHNRRSLSKEKAKILSQLFRTPLENLL